MFGYRRIVVAGGETSGAVAQAVTDALGPGDMRLALKSGNFGAPDFFTKALRMMEDGQ